MRLGSSPTVLIGKAASDGSTLFDILNMIISFHLYIENEFVHIIFMHAASHLGLCFSLIYRK